MRSGRCSSPTARARASHWLSASGLRVDRRASSLLRATNLYGDPQPWSAQESLLATVLSFINCEKYPPSLLYLMMTLGPALLLLAAFETARGRLADILVTFGRVPFFYYVVHIYLIHALAVASSGRRRRRLLACSAISRAEAAGLRARPRRASTWSG